MPIIAGALLAAALAAAPCEARLCQPEALDPWFAKLARIESGKDGDRPLHILQIGDSHTAGDMITGALRQRLQQRFGQGGRGMLPPGRPYRGYLTQGLTASMSADWSIKAAFGTGSAEPRPPLGLSGFSAASLADGAAMSFTVEPGYGFDRLVLCGLTGPGAGRLEIVMGRTDFVFDLASSAERPECRAFATSGSVAAANIVARGGPVMITSWASFDDAGGIALSNLGIVGAQLLHMVRLDEAVVAEELRAYRPDLLVIAFGTNEGFAPRVDPQAYEAVLRARIARLRSLAGTVPLLMLGAPDAGTRNVALAANAPGEAIDCNLRVAAELPAPDPSEAAEAPAEAEPALPPDRARRPLFVPPGMAVVRSIQRKVAADLGIAFWDWHAAMGGDCASVRKVRATPPLMRGDYVHYTRAGGAEIAALLDADLGAAFEQRRGR